MLSIDMLLLVIYLCLGKITGLMIDSGVSSCNYMKLGILCPSCGGTRCVKNLAKGRIFDAFMYNQYIFLMITYFVVIVILFNLDYVFNLEFAAKLRKKITDYKVIIMMSIGWAIFGIIRCILFFVTRDLFYMF